MTTAKAVSTDLRATLTRFMETWNAHDVDGIIGFLTDDILWTEPDLPAPVTGKAAVVESLRATFVAFPDITWPKEDVKIYTTDTPGLAFATWTMVGTMSGPMMGFAPTGKRFRVSGVCIYEFRDGLIAKHTIVYDTADAMTQVGLLPARDSLPFKVQREVQSAVTKVLGLIKR